MDNRVGTCSSSPKEGHSLITYRVALARCADYSPEAVTAATADLLEALEWSPQPPDPQASRPALIKPNLLMPRLPEHCVTTHPAVIAALGARLNAAGYDVVIGDSPGGPFTPALLKRLYDATGMARASEESGAGLSYDVSTVEVEGASLAVPRRFTLCASMWHTPLLVNACKLKTHGLTGITAAVKNLFGCIPGLVKGQYHMNQPTVESFSEVLVDLAKLVSPALSVCDAVIAMEGAGPSHGRPKQVGLLLASTDPFALDYAIACLLGVRHGGFTTLSAAARRGYGPQSDDQLEVRMAGPGGEIQSGSGARALLESLRPPRFELLQPENLTSLQGRGSLGRVLRTLEPLLRTRPVFLRRSCTACGTCLRSCPASALVISDKLPQVELKKCIRCYCCQELCPEGAVTIHRPMLSRLVFGR